MVGAVRQTGDRNGTNDARTQYAEREAAAMGGIVGNRQSVAIKEIRFFLIQLEADRVGTAMKTSGHVALAAYPLHIVGSGPGHRGIKERLGEAAYIDHQAQLAGDGQRAHMRT